jgi:hypothetical protein
VPDLKVRCLVDSRAPPSSAAVVTQLEIQWWIGRSARFNLGRSLPGRIFRAFVNQADIAELNHLVDLSAWPPGTRMIVRRERPHHGAGGKGWDRRRGGRLTRHAGRLAAPRR